MRNDSPSATMIARDDEDSVVILIPSLPPATAFIVESLAISVLTRSFWGIGTGKWLFALSDLPRILTENPEEEAVKLLKSIDHAGRTLYSLAGPIPQNLYDWTDAMRACQTGGPLEMTIFSMAQEPAWLPTLYLSWELGDRLTSPVVAFAFAVACKAARLSPHASAQFLCVLRKLMRGNTDAARRACDLLAEGILTDNDIGNGDRVMALLAECDDIERTVADFRREGGTSITRWWFKRTRAPKPAAPLAPPVCVSTTSVVATPPRYEGPIVHRYQMRSRERHLRTSVNAVLRTLFVGRGVDTWTPMSELAASCDASLLESVLDWCRDARVVKLHRRGDRVMLLGLPPSRRGQVFLDRLARS